jgi:hypothetical protein
VGLVQHAIELAGIATVSVSVRPEVTVFMKVPRAAYLRFPTGAPMGQPHKPEQALTLLEAVLEVLIEAPEPEWVVQLPFRWRRM